MKSGSFKKFVQDGLASQLATISGVTEVRTQVYLPWNKATWNTPKVAHDNPKEDHLHASIIPGFADQAAREAFYANQAPQLNAEVVQQSTLII
ncbi:hypothetical protein RFK91_03385 [Streptococcus suis]|uniref:hypothetical protein n=1 Tax=Streptococcus suis TaxID=1307 RepID=UPI00040F7CB1|nr:hypothetical protein [Streptococcus suis]UUM56049.1 hypothetical protein NQZ93_01640 [Streptococcus suis]